jgi:hypothetical protein
MEFNQIIGLKIMAIKSHRTDMRRKKGFRPEYILFDNGRTYIELEEQDYYTYHDCDSLARRQRIYQDARMWKILMTDKDHYIDSDLGFSW